MLRGEGRGKLSASIDGFILYFLSLLRLELLSRKQSQMPGVLPGQGLLPLVAQDRDRRRQLPRTTVCPHVRRGAQWASRLGRGGLAWLVPLRVSGWSLGFILPWLEEDKRVASRDLLAEPNIRAWLPLRLSICNHFLPS